MRVGINVVAGILTYYDVIEGVDLVLEKNQNDQTN